MKTATLADVTQEEFDAAVQTVISGIKSSDPKLDTRVGTVLRSLLINPEAHIESVTTRQIDYVRKATSLKVMKEAEDAGEAVDPDDVNAIMSNFNIQSLPGTHAEGVVKVSVTDGTQVYTISEGTQFKTAEGLVFKATSTITAKAEDSTVNVSSNSVLYKGASSYFFLVPATAEAVGATYNIPQGTSMSVATSVYTLVSVEAYKTFSGGSDITNLQETIDRIPAGLSIRGFVNKNACEGMLRDKFDSGNHPIIACSTVGYGNGAQRRDKHGIFGIGVGGRIDLYVRNFGDAYTVEKTIKGKRKNVFDASGNLKQVDYTLELTPSDFPGSCWVKSVSSIYDVSSSLSFTCARKAYGVDATWHDFDISQNTTEIFNSVWQGLSVRALEVPPDIGHSTSSEGDDDWSDDREFKVVVYCLPEAVNLQNYVDRDDVRSVSTDVVVRCPIICNVEVKASVVYDTDNPMDIESTKYAIRKYINSLGFVKSLTRSEIVHLLKSCGAVSVDLDRKDMLYGTLHDAYGKEYNLSGDALTLDGLADDDSMLSSATAIFVAEEENIQISMTPNK